MKRKTSILLLAGVGLAFTALAQNNFSCATDLLHHQALQEPGFFQQHQNLEHQAWLYFREPAAAKTSQVLTIPVVVHLIHDNGPENLSDAAVQQAIQWLNDAFANQGAYDQGSGTDAGIRFCLARRTPDNQPTNGITRDQSPLTEFTIEGQQSTLKNLNRWEPKDYLNIWVVRSICSAVSGCGISAYAYFPAYHGSNLDGVVAEPGSFGLSPAGTAVLAHEVGHYLGLYHTFEGGCSNDDCLQQGDRVCDTPPDQSTAGVPCDQTVNTCPADALPDMTWNFLDYGNFACWHDFTEGQAARMNFFLSGARQSLLDSKGCLPPCPLPTVAAFTPGDTTIVAGQALQFDNSSQNAATFSWLLNGVPFSSQQQAAWLFDKTGVFTVQLLAQPVEEQLCWPATAQSTVNVLCPVKAGFTVSNFSPVKNEPVFMVNTSQNSTQFEWFINGVSQGAVLDSAIFSPPGIYVVELQAGNGDCQDKVKVILTVRDSCKNSVFQYALPQGNYSNGYWNSGRVVVLKDGNALLGGSTGYSGQKKQVLFSKITPDGALLWSKALGDTVLSADVFALQPVADGGFAAVTLIGDVNYKPEQSGVMKLSSKGDLLWYRYFLSDSAEFVLRDLVCDPDGSIVACGRTYKPTGGGILIVKFDPDGNLVWDKVYRPGPDAFREGTTIARTSGGDYVIGGHITGTSQIDCIVLKIDADGEIIWNKKLASALNDGLARVKVLTDGTILLAGAIHPLGSGIGTLSRGWLARMSPEGQMLWSRRFFLSGQIEVYLSDVEQGPGNGFTGVGMAADGDLPGGQEHGGIFFFDSVGQALWVQRYHHDDLPNGTYLTDIETAPGGGFYMLSWDYVLPNLTRARWLLKTDDAGFSGDCLPEILTPNSVNFPMTVSTDTYSPFAAPPLLSAVFQANDKTLPLDTICAPECQIKSEICGNNLDDEGDGLFDCLDPDCACSEDICSPGEARIWYFGDHAGLDFRTEPPTVLTNGESKNDLTNAATICDAAGSLLFYTDGFNVYNRSHYVMPNGVFDPFLLFSDRDVYIIPHPGQNGIYYVFTGSGTGVYYSMIDLKLDNGQGDIVPGQKEILLLPDIPNPAIRMTAIRSCAPGGYWLICKTLGVNSVFHAFRIDQNGINPDPVNSDDLEHLNPYRPIKISPDGKRVARAGDGPSVLLYDFDLQTGKITSPVQLSLPGTDKSRGIEFSPGGRFLYASSKEELPATKKSRVFQFDLYAGDTKAINASRILVSSGNSAISSNSHFGYMQLGPDGKIYISTEAQVGQPLPFLHVIHQPDRPAPACHLQEKGMLLTGTPGTRGGLSNAVQSLFARPFIAIANPAPDTVCLQDSIYTYGLRKTGCFNYKSVSWTLEGLSGSLDTDSVSCRIHFTAPGQGRLLVTAHTECGIAADTLNIVVAEPSDKILDLGPDQAVCDNSIFTFNAGSGFERYRWQDGSPDSLFTTLLPGQYRVEVWDACGNRQADSVSISIAPGTILDLGEDRQICPGQSTTFERPAVFSTWQWTPGNFLPCDTCAMVTVAPAATTTWTVVAQTDFGCISVDTLTFFIGDTLFMSIDTGVCIDKTIELFGINLPADTTVQFFFPAQGVGCDTLFTVNILGFEAPFLLLDTTICKGEVVTFHQAVWPADTAATVMIPGLNSECDSVVTVQVHSFPPLAVTLPPDTTLRLGASLTLNSKSSGTAPLSLTWSPGGGLSCASCPDPLASPLQTTLYTLTAVDANGCAARDSVLISVDSRCSVIIPNAFTPNGDGINDRFYPKADPCVRNVRVWRIVSRWGERVFEQQNSPPNDPGLGWDGRRGNGEEFPSDVLAWYVELEYYDGRMETRKGDVALLR